MIPGFIHRRIAHRPKFVRIVDNIAWLFLDKALRLGLGLFVGVWTARYLGPAQYGLLNFAIAFVGLFSAVAVIGLPGVVVRDLVRDPGGAPTTLGTTAVLQLLGGLAAFLMIVFAISFLRPDDALARMVVVILGVTLLPKASEIAIYWFESQVLSKYTVWAQNVVFLVFAGVKIVLITNDAPLIAFAWALLAESVFVALALVTVLAWRGPRIGTLRTSAARAVTLLRDAWPLLLSGVAILVYMKIDQIMLGEMVGDDAVGIYSAAVRISEIWYFIPMAIVGSVFPSIIEAKQRSAREYHRRLQQLYDLMVVLSVAVALPMTFLATPVIVMLFGGDYASSGPVLAIHVWAAVFVFLGVASSRWFLAENRQLLNLQRTVLGAISNVALNTILIPRYGVIGAAASTVVSYGVAAFLADLVQRDTRRMFRMKLDSLSLLGPLQRFARHGV